MDKKADENTVFGTSVAHTPYDKKLTVDELAEALYEGTPHLTNLAEKLARQHGNAGALSFYHLMGKNVQGFWLDIAQQLIDHASEWQVNKGSGCDLSDREYKRLERLRKEKGL